jgi:diketogulonate reductase-like aldo/keto reductase
METAEFVPVLNQIELHPFLSQVPVSDFCREKGIAIEAWSPLARGRLLDHPLITEMAANYDKTTAQVILRWHLQHGNIVIPKSTHRDRIIGNADLYNFQLTEADMAGIDGLNQNTRFDFDPETFTC